MEITQEQLIALASELALINKVQEKQIVALSARIAELEDVVSED